jgi:hypothetical protein
MRRVGQPLIDRYFARSGHAKHAATLGNAVAINRTSAALEVATAEIVASAREYDRIRSAGVRPRWIREREKWVDPRDHAIEVLAGWIRVHQFGREPANDAVVLERIATELFPPIEENQRARN